MSADDDLSEHTVQLGILGRSDGSARWSHRACRTTVVASSNGPLAVSSRDERLGEACLEFRLQAVRGVGGVKERDLERLVADTLRPVLLLQLHPRTLLQVTAQIATDRSALTDAQGAPHAASASAAVAKLGRRIRYDTLAATVNASVMALADSGFPMRGLVAAAAFRLDDEALGAQAGSEEARETDNLVAYSYPDHKLITFESSGKIEPLKLIDTIAHGKKLCDAVYAVMQLTLREKVEHVDGWRTEVP